MFCCYHLFRRIISHPVVITCIKRFLWNQYLTISHVLGQLINNYSGTNCATISSLFKRSQRKLQRPHFPKPVFAFKTHSIELRREEFPSLQCVCCDLGKLCGLLAEVSWCKRFVGICMLLCCVFWVGWSRQRRLDMRVSPSFYLEMLWLAYIKEGGLVHELIHLIWYALKSSSLPRNVEIGR